jgi:hypothetical protein
VRVAPELTVRDPDDTRLTAAIGAIIGGGLGTGARLTGDTGREWFFFAEQLGITGSYNTGTGALTLTGRAPVASYQRALRSIWYRFLGDDPPRSRRFDFRVRDAVGAWSRPARQTIEITQVNDPPVLASTGPSEDPRLVAETVALLDPDSDDLSGATVRMAQGWSASDVDFGTAFPRGITGTYDSGTGTLTLTGTAPVADYQAALRSVEVTRKASGKGAGTFELQVMDASGAVSNILPYVEQAS